MRKKIRFGQMYFKGLPVNREDVSRLVLEVRRQLNISQRRLGAKIDITSTTILEWEKGRKYPRLAAWSSFHTFINNCVRAGYLDLEALKSVIDFQPPKETIPTPLTAALTSALESSLKQLMVADGRTGRIFCETPRNDSAQENGAGSVVASVNPSDNRVKLQESSNGETKSIELSPNELFVIAKYAHQIMNEEPVNSARGNS